jgi:hypothetical protein
LAACFQYGFEAFQAPIAITTAGNNTLVAAIAGTSIRIVALYFISSNTNTVTLKSGANALTGAMDFTSQERMVLPLNPYGWMETAEGEALIMTTTKDVKISGMLTYFKV